jgi:acyl-CoA thioesterase
MEPDDNDSPMGASRFARATSVASDREQAGRYHATIGEEWNCPVVPQGGMVVATAARAMEAELGKAHQQLRSISTVFAGPVRHGDVHVDAQVLRRGRSMSQCSATVHSPDTDAGATAIAVFGGERRGFDFTDITPPDVPPPHECPSFRDPPPEGWEREQTLNFWNNVEGRPALGNAPWDESERTSSLRAVYYKFDEPARLDDGRWDPYAVVALCDTMPGAVGQLLGPHSVQWLPPSADLTVHVFHDAHSEWLLAVNRARHAGNGYASVDIEIWDGERPPMTLAAYATQVMFFIFPQS